MFSVFKFSKVVLTEKIVLFPFGGVSVIPFLSLRTSLKVHIVQSILLNFVKYY